MYQLMKGGKRLEPGSSRCNRTTGSEAETDAQDVPPEREELLLCSEHTGTDCPERLWSLPHLREDARMLWMQFLCHVLWDDSDTKMAGK